MNTKTILTILTSLVSTAVFALDAPQVGSAAPEFSIPDAKGKMHSLSQYKGKYVVLEWFNPECPFVKKHYGGGNMQNLQKEFTGKGVVWLTIDSNAPGTEGNLSPEQAEKVMTAWRTHQTGLLLDPDGKVGRAYGAKNTPGMVVINPEGKIVYQGAIDSKAIRLLGEIQIIVKGWSGDRAACPACARATRVLAKTTFALANSQSSGLLH